MKKNLLGVLFGAGIAALVLVILNQKTKSIGSNPCNEITSENHDWDSRIKNAIKLHTVLNKECEVEGCTRPKTHPYPHFNFITGQEIPIICRLVFPDNEQEAVAFFMNRQTFGGIGFSFGHLSEEKSSDIINVINEVGNYVTQSNIRFGVKSWEGESE